MHDGFLGTRASFMLDFVFLAMFLVVPVMGLSIWLVKRRRQYGWHKRLQVTLGLVLLAAVAAFEADVRIAEWHGHPWSVRAFKGAASISPSTVYTVLYIHLFFAVSTTLLWIYVIVQALRKFGHSPLPNAYSATHRFWARLAAVDMTMTACTGWLFYYLAFVA